MRAPEAEGGADVSVALRSGNGFIRDTAVATNITTGDIVRIADA